MPLTTVSVNPGAAYAALADALAEAKQGDVLAPVTVVVPTNAAGVTARRWLGSHANPWGRGVAAVDMLTFGRVAEVLAGPALAAAGRKPVSVPVVELAVRAVLAEHAGRFSAVAEHPSTVVALRELHDELRLAGPQAPTALALSDRARDAAELSTRVAERLRADWYDEADLLTSAAAALRAGHLPAPLARTVVFLPHPPHGLQLELLRALGGQADVRVLLALTGDARVDAELHGAAEALGAPLAPAEITRGQAQPAPPEVVSVTDADEEVRHAARELWQAARDGVPFARMAVLWPTNQPYARLVEHHLNAADIPWNGRPGTTVAERIVPRFLLDLLDVDRRGLRRQQLFDLLADITLQGAEGRPVPVALWERVSREAGVAIDADWEPRLARYATRRRKRAEEDGRLVSQHADAADDLRAFVRGLRADLGRRSATRRWREWADWAEAQIVGRLGEQFVTQLPSHDAVAREHERVAREHTMRVLDRLRTLDAVGGPPVTRAEFRSVFQAEFDAAPGRLGRIGSGVTVGSLAGAVGLDADLTIVLGAAEGAMPPKPSAGPLIGDDDRRRAGLPSSDALGNRMQRQYLSVLASSARTVVTFPRGDLRASTQRHPTRWLGGLTAIELPSHRAALLDTAFPAAAPEHRLRRHLATTAAPDPLGDPVLTRSLRMRAARRLPEFTEFDGDLSAVPISHFDAPIAPTTLEQWVACPHGYFVRFVLDVRPIDDPNAEFEITALDRGNLLHYTLDRLHREVIDGALPQPAGGWGAEHRQRVLAIFAEYCDEFERTGRTGRPAAWEVQRAAMETDLLEWMEHDSDHLRATGSRIAHSEARFGRDTAVVLPLPDGELRVHGSIDRIDRTSSGTLHVSDHKTGKADKFKDITADDPTLGATRFQLAVYAAGAAHLMGEPHADVHAEYSFFGTGGYKRVGYRFTDEVWATVTAQLGGLVADIERGFFPALPGKPGFQLFVDCQFCQPDGLGTSERWPEWDAKRDDPRAPARFHRPVDSELADPVSAGEPTA